LLKKSTHELSFWWPVRSVFIITKINRKPVSETNQTPAGDHMVACLVWSLVGDQVIGNFVIPWIV